jgi:hypothetical protein
MKVTAMLHAADPSRDLLFGMFALQNDLIDQSALVGAFHAWTHDKSRPLADYLVSRGDLDADQREFERVGAAGTGVLLGPASQGLVEQRDGRE